MAFTTSKLIVAYLRGEGGGGGGSQGVRVRVRE